MLNRLLAYYYTCTVVSRMNRSWILDSIRIHARHTRTSGLVHVSGYRKTKIE